MLEILISIDSSNGVKTKKVIVSNSTSKSKNPRVKLNIFLVLKEYVEMFNQMFSETGLQDTDVYCTINIEPEGNSAIYHNPT